MSFFSRSSKRKPYKHGNHGYNHYRKKNFLDKLFRSYSHSPKHYQQHPMHNQPINPPYSQPGQQPYQQAPIPQSNHQQNMLCKQCNTAIPHGSKFCLHCGWKINEVLTCRSCHTQLPPQAKFCLECGTKTS